MTKRAPSYDLRVASRDDVLSLFETHHGYKSLSSSCTYLFAVYEDGVPVVAYAWQPPPFGAAKSVCPEAPAAVLSLSRMVACPRPTDDPPGSRRLKHISKPLRRQMRRLIDRTRWPVLVTYSDEGQGHNGFVYQCSGWIPTVASVRPYSEDATGSRRSSYSNGVHGRREDVVRAGTTTIQRWESRVCEPGCASLWMAAHGWRRVAIAGKVWASGRQAHKYVRDGWVQL